MDKIIAAIILFILSANSYTVVHTEDGTKRTDNEQIVSKNAQVEIQLENLSPVRVGTQPTSSSAWWSYPSDIKVVTRDGDDLLVLVNKEYKLPDTYVPSNLVNICNTVRNLRCVSHTDHLLRDIVIDDLQALVNDAMANGIDLSVRSAYRSYSTQADTYNYWLSVYGGDIATTDKISARAGHSQHQLGTTIDFSSAEIDDGLGERFATTQASKWLEQNAINYGFALSYPKGYESITGYSYESWHYRYIGRENAQEMVNSGMILELYLRSKN